MSSAAVVGSTGFVGKKIVDSLLVRDNIQTVFSFARRAEVVDKDPNSRLHPIVEKDTAKWAESVLAIQPKPTIFFSALGTTRRKAGGVANQRRIDFDFNLELARAAKESGVRVYVLVSSAGANTQGMTAYQRMKADLEVAVVNLGFEKVVILRPGFLCGDRNGGTIPEYLARNMADALGKLSNGRLKDSWAIDADVVARAAVNAGLICATGKTPEGDVWIVKMEEIMQLGKISQ